MMSRLRTATAVLGAAMAMSSVLTAQTPTLIVRYGPANPPPRGALAGTGDIPVMQIEVTAVGANIRVDAVEVYLGGSGAFADVTTPTIWEDVDVDGFSHTPPDGNLVGWVDAYPAPVPPYWSLLGAGKMELSTIVDGTTETWLITYSMDPGAPLGQTYGVTLFNETGVRESFDARYNPGAGWIPANVVFEGNATSMASSPITIEAQATSVIDPVPGGLSENQFVMVASSINPAGTGFDQIEAQFGPPGPSGNWRLFRYDEAAGRYEEYGAAGFPASMDPRYGWWFITRRPGTLTLQGTSTQGTPSFLIPLPGAGAWYQIGNPYNGTLPLSYIDVEQGAGVAPLNAPSNARTLQTVFLYRNGSYFAEKAAVGPREGFWVYTLAGTQLTINRPPNALKPGESMTDARMISGGDPVPPSPPPGFAADDDSDGGTCYVGATAVGGLVGLGVLLWLAAALGLRKRIVRE
jgi:hypothetical protein